MSVLPRTEHRDDAAGVDYSAPTTLVPVGSVLDLSAATVGHALTIAAGGVLVGSAPFSVDAQYLAWRAC